MTLRVGQMGWAIAASAAAHALAAVAVLSQQPPPGGHEQAAVEVLLAPPPPSMSRASPHARQPSAQGAASAPTPTPTTAPARIERRPLSGGGPATPDPLGADAAQAPTEPLAQPSPSSSASPLEAFRKAVWNRLAEHAPAARTGAGVARVTFTLSADGALLKVRLARSSGDPAFDRACLAAVRAAAPFPAAPDGAGPSDLVFEAPVRAPGNGA